MEVGTNIVAAYVSGGRAHEVSAVMDALALSSSDGFEIAFNLACADLATGNLEAAEQQLLLAQRLGKQYRYLLCYLCACLLNLPYVVVCLSFMEQAVGVASRLVI